MQKISDERLMELLKSDPEKGMAFLMDEYMGLLHNACSLYLNNPEDIRECVQETLVDFYVHLDRFNPSKGSLKSWLYLIARRKACRMAVKNGRYAELPQNELAVSATELNAETDWEEQVADRALLEDALAELKPEDGRIVRMKYFEGKTCAEIAHELGLPLETVKKRQQRSLKKLRRILIAVLILAMLTACAVFVEYHFQFGESTGLQQRHDAENMRYQMVGEPIFLELEPCDVLISNVVWRDKMIYVNVEFYTADLSVDELRLGLYGYDGRLMINSKSSMRIDPGESITTAEQWWHYYKPTEEIVLDVFGETCTIAIKPVEQYASLDEIGTTQTHRGRSVVLRNEEGEEGSVLKAYVHSGDDWEISDLGEWMTLEPDWMGESSSLGVYEEDNLFITFEPVNMEPNTKIYAMQVDLGYMETTDSGKERFHSVSGYWPSCGFFTQIDGKVQLTDPIISKAVHNLEENLKPEMVLRIHGIGKIWEQEYQFQLK